MHKRIEKPFNSVFSWFIKKRLYEIEHFKQHPIKVQEDLLIDLVNRAKNTVFGKENCFEEIKDYESFKQHIPLQNYSTLKPYIDRTIEGEQNLLWPNSIKWFAKSSGTSTGKSKFIPVTKEAVDECHYKGGKDLLGMYYKFHPETRLFNGKHLILGGSSQINYFNNKSYFGDLSAIIVKNLPWWCEWRRTPKREITLMDNWEEKLPKMVESTIKEDVMILAGVPSWVLVFLKEVLKHTGKTDIMDVWPNLELYMHGGVNFKPYQAQFEAIIQSNKMNYVQSYNASEGFFSIQDRVKADDMLLMLDYGIFYEFVTLEELKKENPKVISLTDVEVNTNYAIIVSTTVGLWRYVIGDTIKFTSTTPHRIIVSGRTTHFLNAFGEELIIDNTDRAITEACEKTNATFQEYTVAPIYMTNKQTGGHEWIIEFNDAPKDLNLFARELDIALKSLNSDYEAKRTGGLSIAFPKIHLAKSGLFYDWLKTKNKLGGQHKIPKLSNDRIILEEILSLNN